MFPVSASTARFATSQGLGSLSFGGTGPPAPAAPAPNAPSAPPDPKFCWTVEQPGVQRGTVEQSQGLQHQANHHGQRNTCQQCPGDCPDGSVMQEPAKPFHTYEPACDLIFRTNCLRPRTIGSRIWSWRHRWERHHVPWHHRAPPRLLPNLRSASCRPLRIISAALAKKTVGPMIKITPCNWLRGQQT